AKDIGTDRHESPFTSSGWIFDGQGERVVEYAVALRKRHAMLSKVDRVLLRIEVGSHDDSICTRYISRKLRTHAADRLNRADVPLCRPTTKVSGRRSAQRGGYQTADARPLFGGPLDRRVGQPHQ